MTKSEFHIYLKKSSLQAFNFAEKYVKDKLIDDFKYNLILNASNDTDCNQKFDTYPEDNGIIKLDLSEKAVLDILYRKNKVPVWIDINVLKSSKKSTTFNLLCAGRYTNLDEELYYYERGTGPFGIKSPILPNNYIEGEKFKL
jgi:hypothetical protein